MTAFSTPDAEKMLDSMALPSCPTLLTEIRNELQRPFSNGLKIANMIARDASLASTLLRSANSPLVSGGREIVSIAQAVQLLGFTHLENLVTEGLLRQAMGSADPSITHFWDRAAAIATTCTHLARTTQLVDSDLAYSFGLFHDCGIPLLMEHFPNYKDILYQAQHDPERSFSAIEEETIGTSHCTLGHKLAQRWHLPQEIALAILHHHDYPLIAGETTRLPTDSKTLIAFGALSWKVINHYYRTRNPGFEWEKAKPYVQDYLEIDDTETESMVSDLLTALKKNT